MKRSSDSSLSKRTLFAAALLVASTALTTACGGSDEPVGDSTASPTPAPTPAPGPTPAPTPAPTPPPTANPLCQYAYLYTGSYGGASSGQWTFVVNPITGAIVGSADSGSLSGSVSSTGVINATVGGSLQFQGNISGTGAVSGTWGSVGSNSLSGNRVAPTLPPGATGTTYIGTYSGTDIGGFIVAINSSQISGRGTDGVNTATVDGTVSGTQITFGSTSNGAAFIGQLSGDLKSMVGAWTSGTSDSGTFAACAP